MTSQTKAGRAPIRQLASMIVVIATLHQGAVPLVARLALDRDQRFTPALWLPSPWWWLASTAIVATGLSLLIAIHETETAPGEPREAERAGETGADAGNDGDGDGDSDTQAHRDRANAYDAASGLVFLVGIYNGVGPFVGRLLLNDGLLLALPLRLSAPWWWITSLAVIVASFALLAVIDEAKQRASPDR